MPLFCEPRDELVHDAALDADELVFRLLRQQGELFPPDLDAVEVLEGQAAATSSAAEDERPAPWGISPWIVMSIPPRACPRSMNCAMTPLG